MAHLISSDETQATIEQFLMQIKFKIGNKKTTLVTEDFKAYTNAWKNTIGPHNHIQCLWHLKKNWRLNLIKNGISGDFLHYMDNHDELRKIKLTYTLRLYLDQIIHHKSILMDSF